jgi:hypothetical protein
VLDHNGQPFTSSEDADNALKAHWEPIFNGSGGSEEHMLHFKDYISECPKNISFISRDQFDFPIKVNRNSAPGPDGIAYAAWAAADVKGIDLLYRCLIYLCNGFSAPDWFNMSLMVFIPKGSDGIISSVEAKPPDLRPLTLSNSDQKLLSLGLNFSLVHMCKQCSFCPKRLY